VRFVLARDDIFSTLDSLAILLSIIELVSIYVAADAPIIDDPITVFKGVNFHLNDLPLLSNLDMYALRFPKLFARKGLDTLSFCF